MNLKTLFAALAATTLCACSQYDAEDIQPSPAAQKIGFALDASRAEIRFKQDVCKDGFAVTLNQDGKQIANNAKAVWTEEGSKFEITPEMYWPEVSEEHPCVFHAVSYPGVADAQEPMLTTEDGNSQLAVEIAPNANDQLDLVVASVTATSIPEDGVQIINFTHPLTKVNFTVFVNDDTKNNDCTWKVSSISVKTKSKGVYTFGAANPWTLGEEVAEFQYMKENEIADVANGQSWVGQNNFMLLPLNGEEVTFVVKWLVYKNIDGELKQISVSEASKEFKFTTEDWKPNASLRYASLRLPTVGENVSSDPNDDLDDNNIKMMKGPDVDVNPWDDEIIH